MDATAAAIEELDRAIGRDIRVRVRGGQVTVELPDGEVRAFLDAPDAVAARIRQLDTDARQAGIRRGAASPGAGLMAIHVEEAFYAGEVYADAPLRLVRGGVRAVNPCR